MMALLYGRELQERLDYQFSDPLLLERAVTHRSYANERGLPGHYERLEFLGDAVLGLVTAEWVFSRYPRRPEGELSRLKSSLVSARSLATYARRLDLGACLRVGVGEERSGGRSKSSLLADSLEAVFGAIYLDGGLSAVRPVIEGFLVALEEELDRRKARDFKTTLQELTQARGWDLPVYRVAQESGPDHDKRFRLECRVRGELLGIGEGKSKKVAQQVAARAALARLDPPSERS